MHNEACMINKALKAIVLEPHLRCMDNIYKKDSIEPVLLVTLY